MSVDTTTESAPAPKRGRNILLGLTLFGLLAALWLALGLSTNAFWTPGNISNLLRQGAMTAISPDRDLNDLHRENGSSPAMIWAMRIALSRSCEVLPDAAFPTYGVLALPQPCRIDCCGLGRVTILSPGDEQE